ncbi:MAG: cbb3-type cytochrome c oxidase subunit I [Flavobacteriales bacterium]|nr:cbb3-type cytochrome c oxidase subunit I [Flavobacteriales bacterium]
MSDRAALRWLMDPRNWWKPLLLIFLVSITGVGWIAQQAYSDAPPIVDMEGPDGRVIIRGEDILDGQEVFLKYALMEYGSMFGDGAGRGPDFTAEALHLTASYMREHYRSDPGSRGRTIDDTTLVLAIAERVKRELKASAFDPERGTVRLNEAQRTAVIRLREHTAERFGGAAEEGSFPPPGFISDEDEVRDLSDFFFWGGWVCGAQRPGESFSYTHNWPYDDEAGNLPTSPVMWWSVIGILGFILGLGVVLYMYGQFDGLKDEQFTAGSGEGMSAGQVSLFRPTPLQRATFKFFVAAALVLVVQVLSGVITISAFTDHLGLLGIDISALLPLVVARSWHLSLALFWISCCWIGVSIFLIPMISGQESQRSLRMTNTLFAMIVLLVAGTLFGTYAGPIGLLGAQWSLFGHQGWEFMEFGRVFQALLLAILILWAVILYQGCRPAFRKGRPWALPNWLVYSTVCISVLLLSGFVATPRTNFVIADLWRWAVIHMWVEAFFEVFTTIVVGYMMVRMGLVGAKAAERVIYLATLLFLGSGLLGISHNFYWNAKPVGTMALGSVFSTLQVVPLILLTVEAWRFDRMRRSKATERGAPWKFGQPEVFLFLVAVNFWNFLGAGVFGLIINLPIVNYFEHGTYLTVNHGHAALFGVYGNLSLAGLLFCCKLLVEPEAWDARLVRRAFRSLNVGLMLMVLLDLLPAGLVQLTAVLDRGLWFARSEEFITGPVFEGLTWLRGIGATLFIIGGVLPIAWMVVRMSARVRPPLAAPPPRTVLPIPGRTP